MSTCALTGHRALPADFDKNALRDRLEELILEGCDYFLCGMAPGFDLIALSCLTDLRQRYRFTIEACIPYEGNEKRFPPETEQRYKILLTWCDQKAVMFPSYRDGCFLVRDRYMVDCADFVFAYLTKKTGGTAYTVRYAQKKGLPVLFFENRTENC